MFDVILFLVASAGCLNACGDEPVQVDRQMRVTGGTGSLQVELIPDRFIWRRYETVTGKARFRNKGQTTLSIHQLAAAAGLEYSQIQRIEKGKVNFAFTTLVALAQGLDVDVHVLLAEYKIPR